LSGGAEEKYEKRKGRRFLGSDSKSGPPEYEAGALTTELQYSFQLHNTRAVFKVRILTLLLRVGTLWRCGDGLFFEVPPLASDALLTTLHAVLENVLQTVDHFEISCIRGLFSWLEKPRNPMGLQLGCMAYAVMGFHRSTFSKQHNSIHISPHAISGLFHHENVAPRQEISK
jgi:hypothetical protein